MSYSTRPIRMHRMRPPHEANLLMLDITKAQTRLNWHPRLSTAEAISLTADWYKRYQDEEVYALCVEEIKRFCNK